MSFNIILQTNKSRDNEMYKDLTEIATLSGTLRNECSIQDPVIRIEYDGNLRYCNYFTINGFGRQYFVTDIKSIRDNIFEIRGHCDVLSTAADDIQDCAGIVRRQEKQYNLYLDDGVFKAYSNPMVITKAFPSGFSTQSLVLAVAGS